MNYVANQTVPNFSIVPVGADGTVSFTNNSTGTVQLIADTSGYSTAPATGQAGPHRLQSLTSTPATGTPTTNTFSWDAAGRMSGRAGETLTYTPDGKLATTTGNSTLPANPNPSATAGTPPAPVAGTAGSTGTRYYDAGGNLVGITDGTGTTITLGPITAHSTPAGVQTVTKTYTFAGKAIAQRTAAAGVVKLSFILSDGVDTAQTILQPTSGATLVTAQTRYTDPMGLARGATQTATGNSAYATAPAGVTGVGSNAANSAGYAAPNGYIGGLADTISSLTHLGARDLDPVTGAFTSPDPVLKPGEAKNFSPYVYGEADAINNSDPSGLMILGPKLTDGDGGWYGYGAVDSRWEDSHPFNDYFLPWKPVAYQRSYVPVVPAYQPARPPYNPITGDPVLGHRGLNERTPLPDHYWEDQITFLGITVDLATLGSATLELAAAAAARAAARGAATAAEREVAASAAEAAAARGTAGAAKSADEALAGVDDVLSGLSKGRQSTFRTVGSDAELQTVYNTLSRGGTPIEVPGYKGSWIERADGVRIGLREASRSGGRTIDIRYADGTIRKVHIK